MRRLFWLRRLGQARVIDGDTLDVGPVRVRLHGIEARGWAALQQGGRRILALWSSGNSPARRSIARRSSAWLAIVTTTAASLLCVMPVHDQARLALREADRRP
jgi:hypothetical protein